MDLSILDYGGGWGDELVAGLSVTLRLAAVAIIFGSGFGLLAALLERAEIPVISRAASVYGAVLRSLPELLVIFFIYYGSSLILQAIMAPFGFDGFIGINTFWAGVIALSMIHAAYASEVFRGAFAAVPHGPLEAAQSLGLRRFPTFIKVTFPLAIRYALPGLMNLVIVTLKTTPLVSAIGMQDLIRVASDAGQNTKQYLMFFLIALAIYLMIAAGILALQVILEKRLFRFMTAGRAR
jgi:His/Glu/Gln/Arg/opine family amino acid ABC transporter permease subunit